MARFTHCAGHSYRGVLLTIPEELADNRDTHADGGARLSLYERTEGNCINYR
jgi:hypothetical protein